MNIINGLTLDRLQTENDRLRLQLQDALAYQRSLEAAILAVPLYKTDGIVPQEWYYEERKREWLDRYKDILDRAARPFMKERDRVKNAIHSKMRVWQARISNLVQRRELGADIQIPSPQDLLNRLMRDLATI